MALCGGQPQVRERVVTVDAAGTTTPLVDGPAPGAPVGHWRWAIPSPDGEWVLAQWSGECEMPLAHLVSAGGSTVRPVGEDGVSTTGIGWAPDGRMLVQFGPGLCGSGIDEPGTYAVDADTGARELVRADPEGRSIAARWERRSYPNEVELMAFRAIDELGLTGCCGEPSHGGPGVTAGAAWEGEDIAISASPTGTAPGAPVSAAEPGELAGTPVVFGETDGQPFVAFTCGGYVWRVGSGLQPGPASEAGVHALAETLLPHLYCTVGPRPQA